MTRRDRDGEAEIPSLTKVVAQATLRLRSELECERVIRLAHRLDIASATAYRGPDEYPIFVMLLDEVKHMERLLPEIREAVPDAPISVIREEVLHVSPHDFLRGGVFAPKPFRTETRHLLWVFTGGALGAGSRLVLETAASWASPLHAVFPWGTMVVNVAGSFGIAVFGALLFERFVEERERMFWVLGFLGSFTTFSSYALQTKESWDVSPLLGSLYGGGSVVLGLLAAFLGLWVTRRSL